MADVDVKRGVNPANVVALLNHVRRGGCKRTHRMADEDQKKEAEGKRGRRRDRGKIVGSPRKGESGRQCLRAGNFRCGVLLDKALPVVEKERDMRIDGQGMGRG
ncbi:hypothetical protein JB92DRAFT_2826160 [Gautieria morchelliformis]|nr:hypothetical protein JB92DRAFT_2826160 [Gautieria morchelliformis]